jgi:copper chaperone NosL
MTRAMLHASLGLMGLACAMGLSGCSREAQGGPPAIRYGDSVCAECGMILSDERFSTALQAGGGRGDGALIFDDTGCQIRYEKKHPDLEIIERWTHDYTTGEWISTADAWFVRSEEIRSPMGSNIAAFDSESRAKVVAEPIGVGVVGFESIWLSE